MNTATRPPALYLYAWSVYPLLVPFYLMGKTPVPGQQKVESGVPQIADYYLAVLASLVFLGLPFRALRSAAPIVGALLAFVGYATLVNVTWTMLLEDLSLLKSALYYVYDAVLFLTFLTLYAHFGDRLLRVTVYAVAASVFLQLLLAPLAGGAIPRQELFFNNENQLGYFCVLTATIFALGAARFRVRPGLQVAFYGAVGFLALISQCRGALLGLAALVVVSLLGRPVRLLVAVVGLAAVVLALKFAPDFLGKSYERLAVGGTYDTLATRGYDRMVNHPEHLVLGAGEGAYERFHTELFSSEIHSSFGTLLFCYGVVGLGCFVAFLYFMCRHDPRAALYLVPAFVYGFGHQGVRFAFFWAMLAFVCCIALRPRRAEPAVPDPDGESGSRVGAVSRQACPGGLGRAAGLVPAEDGGGKPRRSLLHNALHQ
jgi:hypothetical protein